MGCNRFPFPEFLNSVSLRNSSAYIVETRNEGQFFVAPVPMIVMRFIIDLSRAPAEERDGRVSRPRTPVGWGLLRNIAKELRTRLPPRTRRGAPQGSTARG